MKSVNSIRNLALLALGAISAVVLLHVLRFDTTSYLSRSLLDSLHLPGFAVVTASAALVANRYLPVWKAAFIAIVASTILGIVSEAAQFFTARDADPWDLVADQVGVLAGTLIFLAMRRRDLVESRPRLQAGLLAVGGLTVLATLARTAWIATMIFARWDTLPVLLTFDHDWEHAIHKSYPDNALTIVPSPDGWPAGGSHVGLLTARGARYPGIIFDPYPDWQNYSAFSFLAASATGKTEAFTLRIHDNAYLPGNYIRFDQEYVANSAPARIRVEFSEFTSTSGDAVVDIAAITEVRIRLADRQASKLIVDDFRLE